MGLLDDDPVAAARWTRDRFDGDVLEYPDAFRLERPPGWTVRGTAGERYTLRPPADGPAVDVDIALARRDGLPRTLDAVGYLELYLAMYQESLDDFTVRADAFGRRADARWTVEGRALAAVVLRTRSMFVLAIAVALAVDTAAIAAGAEVLAALQPLG